MEYIITKLSNPNVLIYLGIVIGTQVIYGLWRYLKRRSIRKRRKDRGLTDRILINNAEKLASRRLDALAQSGLLLASILIVPFILVGINKDSRSALTIAFVVLLGLILFSATNNDDQISIPTHTLWSEVLTSANGGDRSSLCVMNFYLASFISASQRQAAEDAIWNAIQSSVYYEPSKPMQNLCFSKGNSLSTK